VTRRRIRLRAEVAVRDGYRMCTTCTAEKPNTTEFFEPGYVGKCRLCVFLDAPDCTWGRQLLVQKPREIREHRKRLYKRKPEVVQRRMQLTRLDRKLKEIFHG
jgi:hypothetical protein